MKIIQFFSAFLCFILLSQHSFGQCNLTVLPAVSNVHCGDTLVLNAFVGGAAQFVDFNGGTLPNGWQATPGATFNNPCAPGNGSTHFWMGDATPQPRILTSPSFNLQSGSSICFDLRYSIQEEAAPCEGPDEPDEGVYLQYSIDGGTNWINVHYFDPLGGYDPILTQWNNYCFQLPVGALTANTQIRWLQDATSGAEYDHWGLDNISVLVSDTSYTISWQPSGNIGNVDTIVVTNSTSVVNISATNGTESCSTNINLNVLPVDLVISAGIDTTVCQDSCINLMGEATVIIAEGGDTLFGSTSLLTSFLGVPVEGLLNVTGLNSGYIAADDIIEVCLNIDQGANLLRVELICPDSTEIVLFPSGTIIGNTASLCFSTTATQAIDNSSAPYSGYYLPANGVSLNDLVGCPLNGHWKLRITAVGPNPAIASSSSWHMVFNEPTLSRTVGYSWSPSTTLNDPLLLNALACPDDTTVYHLTINDPLGCVSGSDSVRVAVDPNCVVSVLELEEGAKAFVPTAFTPNGDGLNDTFYPMGLGLDEYELLVYDRYNNLVFTSESGQKEWDGRNVKSNQKMPQGVYIWRLSIKDKTSGRKEYNGRVSLLK